MAYVGKPTAHDVAAYILKETNRLYLPMPTFKLQKLIYYAQAWSLAWYKTAMFHEDIEAWANGPVVRELFDSTRGRHKLKPRDIEYGFDNILNDDHKDTIRFVNKIYGTQSSQWLTDLIQSEDPWKSTRQGMSDAVRGKKIIPIDAMAIYYSQFC